MVWILVNLHCEILYNNITNQSKGCAIIIYDSFESSDNAIKAMNKQYLMNQMISVDYAYIKNTNKSIKHGNKNERLLAKKYKFFITRWNCLHHKT